MYMYMYMYMFMYMYMYMHMHMYMYMYAYVYVHVYVYACICMYMYASGGRGNPGPHTYRGAVPRRRGVVVGPARRRACCPDACLRIQMWRTRTKMPWAGGSPKRRTVPTVIAMVMPALTGMLGGHTRCSGRRLETLICGSWKLGLGRWMGGDAGWRSGWLHVGGMWMEEGRCAKGWPKFLRASRRRLMSFGRGNVG